MHISSLHEPSTMARGVTRPEIPSPPRRSNVSNTGGTLAQASAATPTTKSPRRRRREPPGKARAVPAAVESGENRCCSLAPCLLGSSSPAMSPQSYSALALSRRTGRPSLPLSGSACHPLRCGFGAAGSDRLLRPDPSPATSSLLPIASWSLPSDDAAPVLGSLWCCGPGRRVSRGGCPLPLLADPLHLALFR